LGRKETLGARPIQAKFASAVSFDAGAIIPIAAALLAPSARVAEVSSATALVALVILGEPRHTQAAHLLPGAQCVSPSGEHSVLIFSQ